MLKMIYLGADHAGFELKEALRRHLEERGERFEDLGAHAYTKGDDYPIFALNVAHRVAKSLEHRGILLCDTGIGVEIAANKVEGIRAALVHDETEAVRARQHNDANVIALGALGLAPEAAAKLVDLFLDTAFSGEERHLRRIEEIGEAEGD